jgi:hypothetical protein
MQLCLYANNVHYVCFCVMMPIVFLCFRWVHFVWCGYVPVGILMDINQEHGTDEDDRRRSYEEC